MTMTGYSVFNASFMHVSCIMNYWSFTLLSVVKYKTDCQQPQWPLHVPAASLFSVWSCPLSILVTTTPDVYVVVALYVMFCSEWCLYLHSI